MSPNRQPAGVARRRLTAEQEPFLLARALSTTYSGGSTLHPHTHASHQLLFAASGAMTVTGDRTTWMIPPGRAVLIPAGVLHSIRMWGDVAMRSLYFQPTVLAIDTCRVISVSSLLRELILRVAELAAANDILTNPGAGAMTDDVARRSGLSTRTLERLFRSETGMTFGLWRQKARLLESMRVLADGKSVTDAALEAGYASVSAYIAAFKQTFGCTPGAMLTLG